MGGGDGNELLNILGVSSRGNRTRQHVRAEERVCARAAVQSLKFKIWSPRDQRLEPFLVVRSVRKIQLIADGLHVCLACRCGVTEHELLDTCESRIQGAGLRNHRENFFESRSERVSCGFVDNEIVKRKDICPTVGIERRTARTPNERQSVGDLDVGACYHYVAVTEFVELFIQTIQRATKRRTVGDQSVEDSPGVNRGVLRAFLRLTTCALNL